MKLTYTTVRHCLLVFITHTVVITGVLRKHQGRDTHITNAIDDDLRIALSLYTAYTLLAVDDFNR